MSTLWSTWSLAEHHWCLKVLAIYVAKMTALTSPSRQCCEDWCLHLNHCQSSTLRDRWALYVAYKSINRTFRARGSSSAEAEQLKKVPEAKTFCLLIYMPRKVLINPSKLISRHGNESLQHYCQSCVYQRNVRQMFFYLIEWSHHLLWVLGIRLLQPPKQCEDFWVTR